MDTTPTSNELEMTLLRKIVERTKTAFNVGSDVITYARDTKQMLLVKWLKVLNQIP